MSTNRKVRGRRQRDVELLVLGRQLNAAVRELTELETDPSQTLASIEAHLAEMEPIESSILAIPAHGMKGLEVKARVAAQVMSHYWEVPIDRLDFEARIIRLLIDAIFDAAGVSHPLASNFDAGRSRPSSTK